MISTSLPSARRQWVKSDCQTSLGAEGLEADPRAARALARLGGDEARGVEDAPDGRGRRDGQTLPPQVPGDRDRSGIETAAHELRAQRDDPLADLVRGPAGVGARPTRARLDGFQTAVPVPAQQAVQMLPADPVFDRGGGDGQLLGDDLQDGDSVLRHGSDCRACPDSPVAYQVSPMS